MGLGLERDEPVIGGAGRLRPARRESQAACGDARGGELERRVRKRAASTRAAAPGHREPARQSRRDGVRPVSASGQGRDARQRRRGAFVAQPCQRGEAATTTLVSAVSAAPARSARGPAPWSRCRRHPRRSAARAGRPRCARATGTLTSSAPLTGCRARARCRRRTRARREELGTTSRPARIDGRSRIVGARHRPTIGVWAPADAVDASCRDDHVAPAGRAAGRWPSSSSPVRAARVGADLLRARPPARRECRGHRRPRRAARAAAGRDAAQRLAAIDADRDVEHVGSAADDGRAVAQQRIGTRRAPGRDRSRGPRRPRGRCRRRSRR